jgi:hypothetical protein
MIRNLVVATLGLVGGITLMSLASALAGQPRPVVKTTAPPAAEPASIHKSGESRAFSASIGSEGGDAARAKVGAAKKRSATLG